MKQVLVESQANGEAVKNPADGWIEARLEPPSDTRWGARYLVRLPLGYREEEVRRWPVLVFMHGSGERGEDFARLRSQGLPACIDAGLELPAIVVAPQVPVGQLWHPLFVDAVLREVERGWRVDAERIALTGLSMGGMGALATALAFPDRFCAVAAVAAGLFNDVIAASAALPLPPPESWQPVLARIKDLPLWLAHGRVDETVPVICAERLVAIMSALGNAPRTSFYDGVGNDCWTCFYGETPELYDWLLARPRSAQALPAAPSAGLYAGCYVAPDGDEVEVEADASCLRARGLTRGEEILLPLGGGDFVAGALFRFRAYGAQGMRLIEPGLGEFRRR